MIYYHANCNDGFTAAWIAHNATELEISPYHYQGNNNIKRAPRIFFVDCCPTETELAVLEGCTVTIIDHHASREDFIKSLSCETIFDAQYCASVLVWKYFHRNRSIPPLVSYVNDRDLWQHKLPNTHAIRAYMETVPHDLKAWDSLHLDHIQDSDEVVCKGAALIKYKEQQINNILKNVMSCNILQHNVPCVNTPIYQSEIGEVLAQPFSVTWYMLPDGRYKYSLRSNGPDVSAIAKILGGGGHKLSAGFILPYLLDMQCTPNLKFSYSAPK